MKKTGQKCEEELFITKEKVKERETASERRRRLRPQKCCTFHLHVIWPAAAACLFIIDWNHALYFTLYMGGFTSGQHLKGLITSQNTR